MGRATLPAEGTTFEGTLRRGSGEPLHVQLCGFLRRAIAAGTVPQRLPSTRWLAKRLGVSRNTVLAAYEELRADGLIDSRAGSGTWRKGVPTGGLKRADLVRDSHYPFEARAFRDPDGNPAISIDRSGGIRAAGKTLQLMNFNLPSCNLLCYK